MSASQRKPVIERLVVLTLALEEALRGEAWTEADSLFQARADALEAVFNDPEVTSADLAPVLAADDRLHRSLESSRNEVVDLLKHSREARSAAFRYRQGGGGQMELASA
jgi:hypothetical protein